MVGSLHRQLDVSVHIARRPPQTKDVPHLGLRGSGRDFQAHKVNQQAPIFGGF